MNNLRTTSGRIHLKSKTGQFKASVGYHVTVPGSYLHYNLSSTKFLAADHRELPSCQQLNVVNDFALPVDVIDASIAPQVTGNDRIELLAQWIDIWVSFLTI